MTQDEIREVVKITLDELSKRKLLKDSYTDILRVMDKRLYKFFNGNKDAAISSGLRQLSDDPYIDIIYLQYRDNKTLEWIAEYYRKDTSTIKRNKKRMIIALRDTIGE